MAHFHTHRSFRILLGLCVSFSSTNLLVASDEPEAGSGPSADEIKYFENEIRPLLAKHCYECHSTEGKQEGELRLDSRSFIVEGGASGPAAVPQKPADSLIVEAVQYRGLEMPPNGKLPQPDIDKIVRWVEMGLPWPKEDEPAADGSTKKTKTFEITEEQRAHWSFQPISDPAPPSVDNPEWNQNPIDRFLYSRWRAEGIQPQELADRRTLLRRVTYDLTGLPPTVDELNSFLADESADAWTRVIDRLLASPHYGERWGRHWLDVVRYADTSGNASDHPVADAYKYRNYVIDSFNKDKPYDQFLREQYAGDLLAKESPPEQYTELVTATGHLAISRRFGFNDTNFLDFHLTMQDLLDTMGQSVLGLNIGCARCHDHKFEPVSASDYYALYGIFASSKFSFPGAEETPRPKELIPAVPPEEAEELQREWKQRLAQLDREIEAATLPILNLEGNFEEGQTLPPTWRHDKEAIVVQGASSTFTNVFPPGQQSVQLPNAPGNLGCRRPLPTCTVETESPLHLNLDFRNVDIQAGGDGYYRIALDHPENNFSPAVELFVNAGHLAVRDGDGLREIAPLKLESWYNLQLEVNWQKKQFFGVISDGSQQWTFEAVPFHPDWDGTVNSWVVDGHGTDKEAVRPARQLDNFFVQATPFLPAGATNSETASSNAESIAQLRESLKRLRQEKTSQEAISAYPTVYGVVEGTPTNVRIQLRGEPGRLGEEVPRRFLQLLGGEAVSEGSQESGRRELAEWLTSPSNPLTARVMANRIWFYHFGRGIVATPNDFGVRGEAPTDPELLDFLATTFRKEGYSFKSMHRLILTSRAYQLSSRTSPESQKIDPENKLYWHYNRHRLDAESLRDTWLALSGELDLAQGGEHPFPPSSQWGYSQHNPFDAVYDSKKRTVYLMTQRIKRHPFLALFDGADPNASTGKREATTTPSQALFLMNDEFIHQRSTVLARRLLQEFPTESAQIQQLYEMAFSRPPSETEISHAERFRRNYAEKFAGDADKNVASLAAYVRVILSSNEFMYLN
ncbi:PSD1 and planctomycete cytochrome C domain-containing protein [Planctomicrobium sp. SH661]|uniref:PSD1 and planctomycete cytochrome C domain-containing protein n=1 Tax=Planctomicrobium sp. SH661 TaxID=3448124 RepID=UPI003F5B1D4D